MKKLSISTLIIISIMLIIILSLASLFIGVSDVTLGGLLANDENQTTIFVVSRFPRLMAVLTSGIGLSVAGLIMQQLARNKFVSPATAGTLQSAGLGIVLALVFFGAATLMQKMLMGFACSLIGTFIFVTILDRIKYKDIILVPLVGIMFAGIVSSVSIFFAYRYDLLQALASWLLGDFSGVLRGRYELLYITVPFVILGYFYADRFTLAGMGEDFAVSLGLNYKQVVNIGLVIVALITSAVVVTAGSIPFLGLIVPNLVSITIGDNVRRTLPITALLGANVVLICDIVSRLIIWPYEIPIGLTIGVIGSLLFLYMLFRSQRQGVGYAFG